MISRIVFNGQFRHAMLTRGLTLTDVAELSGLSVATISRAVAGKPVNMQTALRLAQSVRVRPVVPELESWVRNEAGAR